MSYYLNSVQETKQLTSEMDVREYLESIAGSNTRTFRPNANSTFVSHAENLPLLQDQVMEALKTSPYLDNPAKLNRIMSNLEMMRPESVVKHLVADIKSNPMKLPAPDMENEATKLMMASSEDNGMMLSWADKTMNHTVTAPMTWQAFGNACEFAGFGRARALLGRTSNILYEARADMVNTGFQDLPGTLFVLYRYDRVLAIRSGGYHYLSQERIYDSVKKKLQALRPEAKFRSGRVSWDFFVVEFLLNDEEEESGYRLTLNYRLQEAGSPLQFTSLKAGVRLSTSDTGMSAVTLTPVVLVETNQSTLPMEMTLGRSKKMRHDQDASWERLEQLTEEVLANGMTEFGSRIEELGMIPIQDVSRLLDYLGKKNTELPRAAVQKVSGNYARKSGPFTGIDVFLALNEIAAEATAGEDSLSAASYLALMDKVASMIWLPFDSLEQAAILAEQQESAEDNYKN